MEFSIYDVHYIASKYLNLQRHVYVVSDWLVFFCSFLCCQCGEYLVQDMRFDGSEASSIMYQITSKKLEASTDRLQEVLNPRPLVIDDEVPSKPQLGGTSNCMEPWSLVDNPRDLERSKEPITPQELEDDTTLSDELLIETEDPVMEQLTETIGSTPQCTELWNLVEKVELDGIMEPITSRNSEKDSSRPLEGLFDTLPLVADHVEVTDTTLLSSEPWSIVDPQELDGRMATVNNSEPTAVKLSHSPRSNKRLSPVASRSRDDYPTVHSHRKQQETSLV